MGRFSQCDRLELVLLSTVDILRLLVILILYAVQQTFYFVWWTFSWVVVRLMNYGDPHKRPLVWDWRSLNIDDIAYPDNFLWGVASSSHQVEGNSTNNNWSHFETEFTDDGSPTILNGDKCGIACDHWNRLEEDTQLISDLGANAYRFSLEWSKTEPSQGVRDQKAIDHYHQEIDLLKKAGIEPLVTLWHWTVPLWFDDLGGFENGDINKYFVRFAVDMYKEFGKDVKWWILLNEPTSYTSLGYILGCNAPGRRRAFEASSAVLLNLLKCHVEMYASMKTEAKIRGQDCMIGLNTFCSPAYSIKWHNMLDYIGLHFLHHLHKKPFFDFFQTGKYHFYCPFIMSERYTDLRAPHSFDFIGLNYYLVMKVDLGKLLFKKDAKQMQTFDKYEVHLDAPGQTLNAEGLYTSVHEVTKLLGNKPILVTECGMSDFDETRRKLWLKRHFYTISKIIREGYNLQGFLYWSLYDNFEWHLGYTTHYGLYSINWQTQERTLKEGAVEFARVLNEYKRGGLRLQSKHKSHEGDFEDTEDTEDASLLTKKRYMCGGIRIQHTHPTYGFNGGTSDHTNGTGHLPADNVA